MPASFTSPSATLLSPCSQLCASLQLVCRGIRLQTAASLCRRQSAYGLDDAELDAVRSSSPTTYLQTQPHKRASTHGMTVAPCGPVCVSQTALSRSVVARPIGGTDRSPHFRRAPSHPIPLFPFNSPTIRLLKSCWTNNLSYRRAPLPIPRRRVIQSHWCLNPRKH